jgi:hypothetical protein
VRLWCWPGATFELGKLTVLIAPPDRMGGILELPEISQFHTRYLNHGLSEVLYRVPPIRSEHFEPMACGTLDELIAAVRTSVHTILLVEWDPAFAAGLEVEERGQRMHRLTAALKRRATSAIVVVYAPAVGPLLRMVADGADQTVWLQGQPVKPRATVAVAARAKAQRALW